MKHPILLSIAEDDKNYAEILILRLQKFTQQIQILQVAADGSELVTAILQTKQHPQIILMDIQMRGMNGIEATLKIKQVQPHIKIIAYTQWDNPERIARMLLSGADAFICKTIPIEEQVNIICTVYQGSHKLNDHPHAMPILEKMNEMQHVTQAMQVKHQQTLLSLCKGKSREQMANEMGVSVDSIKNYIKELHRVTGTDTSAALIKYAFTNGFLI
ncbi:MAG: response regulator transcription factor [Bacteroidia bacterium]|nr:response regulator transcription factor [Bacteroidia bacterium]MBP7260224.1 response regulator transcription factor [Bacteroidia bacterium]MBP9179811.1 response regulator transcription factor [Bacteroidia bacterium]MBP9723810.1 response regulator transcription factor [Bacteroidia bacterium]